MSEEDKTYTYGDRIKDILKQVIEDNKIELNLTEQEIFAVQLAFDSDKAFAISMKMLECIMAEDEFVFRTILGNIGAIKGCIFKIETIPLSKDPNEKVH